MIIDQMFSHAFWINPDIFADIQLWLFASRRNVRPISGKKGSIMNHVVYQCVSYTYPLCDIGLHYTTPLVANLYIIVHLSVLPAWPIGLRYVVRKPRNGLVAPDLRFEPEILRGCELSSNPHILLLNVPQILKTRVRVKFWEISDRPFWFLIDPLSK